MKWLWLVIPILVLCGFDYGYKNNVQTGKPDLVTTKVTTSDVTGFNLYTSSVLSRLNSKEPTLPLTTLGDTLYQDASGRQRLPGNTSNVQKFLSQTGNGTNSAAPSWQPIPSAGRLTYYFQNISSNVGAGTKKMLTTTYTPKTTLSYPSLSGTTLIQKFATDPGFPGLTFIPAGEYIFHIHAAQTGGTKATTLYGQFWEINSAGIDIAKIGDNTEITPSLTGSEAEYILAMVNSNTYTLASSTSRIALRIYAVVSGGGSTPTAALYLGDEADSHIELPANSVDATNFVPYTGATATLNLGTHTLTAAGETLTGDLQMSGNKVTGNTTSGGTLTLSSTSHATKGTINFGTSAYDEVNQRLGIGSTAPASILSLTGSAATTVSVLRAWASGNSNNAAAAGQIQFGTSINANPWTEYYGAKIYGLTTEAWTAGSKQGTALVFGTTPTGSTTITEGLRVDQDQTVIVKGGTNIVYYCNGGTNAGLLGRGNGGPCSGGTWVATHLKLD